MLKKLDQTDSSESVRVNIQSMETGRWADESRIKEIVYSPGNAIGKLEAIDKTRSATLRFIESAKEIGVQVCSLLYVLRDRIVLSLSYYQ